MRLPQRPCFLLPRRPLPIFLKRKSRQACLVEAWVVVWAWGITKTIPQRSFARQLPGSISEAVLFYPVTRKPRGWHANPKMKSPRAYLHFFDGIRRSILLRSSSFGVLIIRIHP